MKKDEKIASSRLLVAMAILEYFEYEVNTEKDEYYTFTNITIEDFDTKTYLTLLPLEHQNLEFVGGLISDYFLSKKVDYSKKDEINFELDFQNLLSPVFLELIEKKRLNIKHLKDCYTNCITAFLNSIDKDDANYFFFWKKGKQIYNMDNKEFLKLLKSIKKEGFIFEN